MPDEGDELFKRRKMKQSKKTREKKSIRIVWTANGQNEKTQKTIRENHFEWKVWRAKSADRMNGESKKKYCALTHIRICVRTYTVYNTPLILAHYSAVVCIKHNVVCISHLHFHTVLLWHPTAIRLPSSNVIKMYFTVTEWLFFCGTIRNTER